MQKVILYIASALGWWPLILGIPIQEFPSATITNGIVHAQFYLPDSVTGYYRATRFDWSGVMPELSWEGHTYCSQWFGKYDPHNNEAVMGPVEAFDPLGYDSANAGGHFVQVGVGILSKPAEGAYSPFKYYPVADYGQWTVKAAKAAISFTHKLTGGEYPYEYTKTISLKKNRPVFEITHRLLNTGRKMMATTVYNHNLFVLDGQSTGPGGSIRFPFIVRVQTEGQRGFGPNALATILDSTISFNRAPARGESVYGVLDGYDPSAGYSIRMENKQTGAALRITCDHPLSKLVFWGAAAIYSPEPYIKLQIPPGEERTWTISYELYDCKK